jgi:O-antigen/teichoic acid export membrane protein
VTLRIVGSWTVPNARGRANPLLGGPRDYVRPIAGSLITTVRERNPLPPGAGAVGIALGIAGASAYGFLVVAARALSQDEYSRLSVVWALVLVVGPGFFLPVEQEIARALAARRAIGDGGGPVVRRAAALAGTLLGALVVLGLAAGPLLTDHLFDGRGILLVAFLVSLVAACGAHLVRGTLSGLGRFGGYARIIGGESAVRVVLAIALAVVGVDTVGPYGVALAIGSLVAVGWVVRGEPHLLAPGSPAAWSEVTTALAWLLAGSVLSMALLNAGPIAMELLADESESDQAGTFLAGLVISRIPLFLFQAVQASLLPRLSELAGEGRTRELRAGLGRLVAVVGAVGLVGIAGSGLLGPWVVELLFGGDFVLGRRTMLLLATGSAALMLATLLAQATIALSGHYRMAVAWLVGVAALVITLSISSDDLFLRVELGCMVGGLAALVAQGAVLIGLLRAGAQIDPGDLIEAMHADLPIEP